MNIEARPDSATPPPAMRRKRRPGLNSTGSKSTSMDGDAFFAFKKQIEALDKQLRKLSNKGRQLGSSVGILSASSRLRERLGRVLHLFRENAADLFPQRVKRKADGVPVHRQLNGPGNRKVHRRVLEYIHSFPEVDQDRKYLLSELQAFSRDISTLVQCFGQFPDFVDEIPDYSIGEDLVEWSAFLNTFEDGIKGQAVQIYLYSSMDDIGERLKRITEEFIPTFIKLGIPAIRASQEHSITDLTNLATVATLFASVTANMLALSTNTGNHKLLSAVNTFWFISLVFSISAAVNSLLHLTWTQAIFRSPDDRIPWWVRVWMKNSPIAFLVLSVACFSVGLVLFTFWSNQAEATIVITTVLSSLCSFGLAAMSSWFACEFWVFQHFGGNYWLADVLAVVTTQLKSMLLSICHWDIIHPQTVWMRGKGFFKGNTSVDAEMQTLPRIGFPRMQQSATNDSYEMQPSSFWSTCDKTTMTTQEIVRYRWHEAARRIKDSHELLKREVILSLIEAPNYSNKLAKMAVSRELTLEKTHKALVRVLEFSPDGKSLVTSSWDKRSFILNVESDELPCMGILDHHSFVQQLQWSPDGIRLLMRQDRRVSAWGQLTEGTACCVFSSELYNRDHTVHAVGWHISSEGYLYSEGDRLVSMTGIGLASPSIVYHRISNLIIRDFAATKDSRWLICVGEHRTDYDKPSRKKYEIAVISLMTFKVITRVPVYREMSNIVLAGNGRSALVSSENRLVPPELWELNPYSINVVYRHTYVPEAKPPLPAFASLPSIFGGSNDQFVLRAGITGEIFTWIRDTAIPLYTIRPPVNLGQLTAFAWNRGAKDWMFATGTLDGAVHIWTVCEPQDSTSSGNTAPDYPPHTLAAGNEGDSALDSGPPPPDSQRNDSGSDAAAGMAEYTDSPTRERSGSASTDQSVDSQHENETVDIVVEREYGLTRNHSPASLEHSLKSRTV